VESLRYIYVFRHSRSPEEIIEARRVRAVRSGASGYGLRLQHTRSRSFDLDQEALWGGHLADYDVADSDGTVVHLRRFEFDRRLRRGESHDFGIRSWVTKDPEPSAAVEFTLTIPAKTVDVDLVFGGPAVPVQAWCYQDADGHDVGEDRPPRRDDDPAWLTVTHDGHVSARWRYPQLKVDYGVAWTW
jgi:hypothetical protein